LIYLALTGELTAIVLIKTILVVVLANFFYNIIYIVNDLIDYREDLKEKTYKMSAISHYGMVNYVYGYAAVCVALLLVLRSSDFLGEVGIYFSYLLILTATAVIHSKFSGLKPVTIFAERWFRALFPVFLLNTVFASRTLNDFFILILFLFPVIMHKAYSGYLEKKKKQFGLNGIVALYFSYYGLLSVFLSLDGTMSWSGFILFAAAYAAIYSAMKTIAWITANFFSTNFLRRFYAHDLEEKGRIFVEMAANSAALVFLCAYTLII